MNKKEKLAFYSVLLGIVLTATVTANEIRKIIINADEMEDYRGATCWCIDE